VSIALLMNVPVNVKFVDSGTDLSVDPLDALLGDFYSDWTGGPEGLILQLDASLKEDHNLSSDVSQNPIEDGSLVSDNVTIKPQRLTIEGTVTDTPVQYLSAVTSGLGGIGSISNATGVMPTHINAWFALKEAWKNKVPFDVATGLDLYRNMVIADLSVPREATIGRQLLFTAQLAQAKIVTKEATSPGSDLLTTEEDVGYLTSQIPDAVTIAAAAVFLGLIVYAYAK